MTRQEIEERFERTNLHGLYDKQPAAKLQSSVRKAGANLPKLPPKPVRRRVQDVIDLIRLLEAPCAH